MTRRRPPRPVLAGLVAVVALLAGSCSSDGSEGSTGTTAPADTEAPAPSASGGDGADGAASAGCAGEPLPAGRSVVTVESGGIDRSYVRYVPEGLAAGAPAPVVLDLTAYSPASLQESFSQFTQADADGVVKADEVGAVVVTPEPVNGVGLLTWNYVGTPGWTDDQQFVTDLLDDVEAAACTDPDRVLVMGFAVGGVFGSIVACEQADRFAALVTVAGLYRPEDCAPSAPLPVLSFHGTGDRFVPFDGSVGSGAGGLGLSPETTAGLAFMAGRDGAVESSRAWAEGDGCETEPTEEPVADGVTRQVWGGCDDGVAVELYVIDGGEHTWPGSDGMSAYEALLGPVSDAVDANDVIWSFFEAQTS